MLTSNEWEIHATGSHYTLNVGSIGCLHISEAFEGLAKVYTGKPLEYKERFYRVTWHESEMPIYGEGIQIVLQEKFPRTPEGLAIAKERAIELARGLLQEAMDSLKGHGDSDVSE